LRKRGRKVLRPDQCTATADHNVPTRNQDQPIRDPLSATQVETLTANCKEFGIELFGIGHKDQGIVHVIGPEQGRTLPGMTIVCGDSHTSTHGAFGAIAFGIGTSQVEQVLATQCLLLKRPKTMRITIDGQLHESVSAKDVILYIIAQLGVEGATGHFVEYSGDVFRAMSMEERMTVCNMSIEMGAKGGLMSVDETTLSYLDTRLDMSDAQRKDWSAMRSDEGVEFDLEKNFNAADISVMVTVGTAPDTGIALNQKVEDSAHITSAALDYMGFSTEQKIAGQSIDHVFIGSCTNGRIEDLRAAAAIVKGRRKAEGVIAWVVPGSMSVRKQAIEEGLDDVFIQAGFEFREPGCSACLAMNDDKVAPGALCVSTSNRNFEGRQGQGARTVLASPITAAASAITGVITDPKLFMN